MSSGKTFPVPDLVHRRAVSEGAAGLAWLVSLDQTLFSLEHDWSITIGDAMLGGSAAFVAEAHAHNGDAFVVKVATPASAARHEAEVLRLAGGKGYAGLIRQDPVRNAMLLEKLGDRLDRLDLPYEQQINLLCATLLEGWMTAPATGSFVTGAEKANALAADIVRMWKDQRQPCAPGVIERALLYCKERAISYQRAHAVLAHGDPHPANLLAVQGSGNKRFKYVDPDGLVIEPAYDLGVLLRAWDEGLNGRHPHDMARSHARHLGTRTQVSPEAIWQWGFIERVSSGLTLLHLGETDKGRSYLRIAEALNTF